jgi:hypothetical protein
VGWQVEVVGVGGSVTQRGTRRGDRDRHRPEVPPRDGTKARRRNELSDVASHIQAASRDCWMSRASRQRTSRAADWTPAQIPPCAGSRVAHSGAPFHAKGALSNRVSQAPACQTDSFAGAPVALVDHARAERPGLDQVGFGISGAVTRNRRRARLRGRRPTARFPRPAAPPRG